MSGKEFECKENSDLADIKKINTHLTTEECETVFELITVDDDFPI